ncbi:hypothetical protein, partial [Mesorhizobium sp. M1A.T.Ca.IN.004.03.1.1]|uniref:hypothetical protein n=1 Tax=Mesorhizobium sp. M1A.T.Ca.IN.004.03.1.1 TaxID=2496795 RepID=UPI0019D01608
YQTFIDLTRQAARTVPPPDLYVWAESTAPQDALHNAYTKVFMGDIARDTQAGVLVGTTITDRRPERQQGASGDPNAVLRSN